MGVLSLTGRAITRVKNWVLKCDSCFHFVNALTKRFCPRCGAATLAKLSYAIDRAGNKRYFYKMNRRVNTRGF